MFRYPPARRDRVCPPDRTDGGDLRTRRENRHARQTRHHLDHVEHRRPGSPSPHRPALSVDPRRPRGRRSRRHDRVRRQPGHGLRRCRPVARRLADVRGLRPGGDAVRHARPRPQGGGSILRRTHRYDAAPAVVGAGVSAVPLQLRRSSAGTRGGAHDARAPRAVRRTLPGYSLHGRVSRLHVGPRPTRTTTCMPPAARPACF